MEKDNNGIIPGGVGVGTTTGSNSITTAGTNNTILPPKVSHWLLVWYYLGISYHTKSYICKYKLV